ncbi:MAG: hypothetical protein MR270_07415, partial [Erysipelotrichaceae bacterium]|nr:hypothetical protein [Erysipelotrichaceae bacterium]
MLSCVLCGCSNSGTTAQKKGTVDCYSIFVRNGGSSVFSGTYSTYYSQVHEYKDSNGNSIYANCNICHQVYNEITDTYDTVESIFVYSDRYTVDYTEYSYVGFIGWLTVENNYYLDLDKRIIDSETKWSEYLYDKSPSGYESLGTPNNKEAFKKAKNNYYQISSYNASIK